MNSSLPAVGALLGVDFGTKRLGLAVCDSVQRLASPLMVYSRRTPEADAEFFKSEVQRHRAVGLVLGLPLHLTGDEMRLTKKVKAFGAWLTAVTGLPVEYVDERLTSARADEMMEAAGLNAKSRRERLDKVAAQILLQAYLEEAKEPRAT